MNRAASNSASHDTPKIYAYTTDQWKHTPWKGNKKGRGLLKIGYTGGSVERRISQQFPVPGPIARLFKILLSEDALDNRGLPFKDYAVHKALIRKGFRRAGGEWFECTVADLQDVLSELREARTVDYDDQINQSIELINVYDAADFGNAIRLRRRRKGWSQSDLANKLEVHRVTIAKLERGEAVSSITAINAIGVLEARMIIAGISDDVRRVKPLPSEGGALND